MPVEQAFVVLCKQVDWFEHFDKIQPLYSAPIESCPKVGGATKIQCSPDLGLPLMMIAQAFVQPVGGEKDIPGALDFL